MQISYREHEESMPHLRLPASERCQFILSFDFVFCQLSNMLICLGKLVNALNNNNDDVHLSCAHQRLERSHDTY